MAATIKIKNSSTAGAAPTSSDLVQGELAVNVTDKRLFTENSGGTVVELGTNPSSITLPDGSASAPTLLHSGDTNTGLFFPAADTIALTTGGTERARVDSSGNLGLGVTPSAWGGGKKILQASNASFAGQSDRFEIWANAYYDGSAVKYISNGYATLYQSVNGAHSWQTAASGTAGGTVTLTQAMTLDASGNLGIGTTSPSNRVSIVTASGSDGIVSVKSPTTETAGVVIDGGTSSNKGSVLKFSKDASVKWQIGTDSAIIGSTSDNLHLYGGGANAILFSTNATERARIDSSGNLLVGTTSSTFKFSVAVSSGENVNVASFDGANYGSYFYTGQGTQAANAAATVCKMTKNSSTGRSLNAGGTVNASGADYAEYMTKAGTFTISKGDVVGINAEGKLTNVFADAVSFCVKSTDPSYVGGDVWGSEEALGLIQPTPDASQEEKDAFETALEAARQTVDRIAFAGQVPVNVTGATAGQYIIPVNDNGSIKGQAVSNPTFEQYQIAVGKVIAIEQDGRARIIVKVA